MKKNSKVIAALATVAMGASLINRKKRIHNTPNQSAAKEVFTVSTIQHKKKPLIIRGFFCMYKTCPVRGLDVGAGKKKDRLICDNLRCYNTCKFTIYHPAKFSTSPIAFKDLRYISVISKLECLRRTWSFFMSTPLL